MDPKPGDTCALSYLSLTGRLSLQGKKDKKGKIAFKKKAHYWFWFDENECCLKYYKSSDSYWTNFHHYEGKIDLKNAKVTPSEVYLDDKGSPFVDQDVVSNKTFLIFTNSGSVFALTADKDSECHNWIKKLQEKRASWGRKEKTRPKTIHVEFLSAQEGLVYNLDAKSRTPKSHVHKIFEEFLGPDQLPPPSSPKHLLTDAAQQMGRQGEDSIDGDEEHDKPCSLDVNAQLSDDDHDDHDVCRLPILTQDKKKLLKLQVVLSKTCKEKEHLQQKVALLEDEAEKHNKEKLLLLNEIQELAETVHKLKADTVSRDLENENINLKDIIGKLRRSLVSIDGELELYKKQLEERDKQIQNGYRKQRELEDHLLHVKTKYVSLLDYSFKIPTPIPAGVSVDDPDPDELKLKQDLLNLIQEETSSDTSLIDVSGDLSVFEDQYGELHDWSNDSNICHFLCRQLYLHYTENDQEQVTQSWYEYVKHLKLGKENHWEIPGTSSRGKRRELRNYLRKGIPYPVRATMWGSLVHSHVGKMREFMNSTAAGGNYYQSLLLKPSSFCKLIKTDLHRTIPSNKHFRGDGLGIKKLERILVAFSNHNVNIGYCQGMNMITAVGLLFLDEESAFWFLVAIVEKILPQYYFSHGLSAVRADQEVMKALVAEKLPYLNEHLQLNGTDVTIVTFKWFLTLFVDGLPTESALRVMDCFLLEGHKIFFRIALGIFRLYENRLLSLNDPVTMFMLVKEVAKHTFNVEELFRVAFNEFKPFPSRATIESQRQPFLRDFLAESNERERMKLLETPSETTAPAPVIVAPKQRKQLRWECGTAINSGELWLSCGDRQGGRICIISHKRGSFDIKSPNVDVGSKILCIKAFPNDIAMIGTLDFSIHAISTQTQKELWSIKLNDSVLDFVWYQDTLLCALADGYIATLFTAAGDSLPFKKPVLYRIGSTAVQCMVLSPINHVWIGCGKVITVLEAGTHEPVKAILMPDKAGKVYRMEISDQGIWVTFKTSTLLCLYDHEHMVKLLIVDYSSLIPRDPGNENFPAIDDRITVMTTFDDIIWIGTGNASVHLFRVSSAVARPEQKIQQMVKTEREFTSSLNDSLRMISIENDEGLVGSNNRKESVTVPAKRTLKPSDAEKSQERGRYSVRPVFGREFRKQTTREKTLDLKKPDEVYQINHLFSSQVLPRGKECVRVTVAKPIRKGQQQFVISCVNSSSMADATVQLWGCAHKSSLSSWNYTTLPECYDVVCEEISRPPSICSPPVEKGRSYSTTLCLPVDTSQPLIVTHEESKLSEHDEED